jgi:hypothetical protein
MTNRMNCQTAQEQMQELLDQRWSKPIPGELQEHLSDCQPCQSWQTLFQLEAVPRHNQETVPVDFASQVVQRYSREQRRNQWFRNTSFLAIAASLLAAVMVWFLPTQPNQLARNIKADESPRDISYQLLNAVRKDYVAIQSQISSIPTPSLTIPSTISTAWEFRDLDDPLAIGMPAFRTLGTTLQGAVEPYEAPTRAVFQKVKSLIDDPDVKKAVETVKRRLI